MWTFLQIVVTAALTTLGTLLITRYTLESRAKNEEKLRSDDLERHARYLAIRVICALDPFISQCCDVVQDDGMEDAQGERSAQVSSPVLSLPDDVDWKTIQPDLMYRILGLPNAIDVARQSIAFAWNEFAGPPDYEEYFDERALQFGRLGLAAFALGEEIRKSYGIKRRDYGNWSPTETLNKAIAEATKTQEKRQAANAEMWDEVLNTPAEKHEG